MVNNRRVYKSKNDKYIVDRDCEFKIIYFHIALKTYLKTERAIQNNARHLLALTYIDLEIHPNLAEDSVELGGRSRETITRKWD
ncbi:unnamed protein product [Acanthoscelides obtectus]|uniref:Uncharacterized protein n=1 Tax=Acanthoscelides obtectus TaxID=200917 RepID=A0A9P0PBG6_ACAOB|nr:unnamed protein product [Acanthoscelides obtectus]CAK1655798.1 hypothetical protein AOBTE_LOCUS19345 [Acanthoscelides obtectus]